MTGFLALLMLGVGLTVVQGAVAFAIPPPWCPDLSILFVIAMGLYWRRFYSGLLLATLLGFVADVLSGSLFGAHALLRMVVFAVTWRCGRQLDLRGRFALFAFAGLVSLFDAAATLAITGFFGSAGFSGSGWLAGGLIHAGVNGLFALPVAAGVALVVGRAEGDTGDRHGLILEREGHRA